MSQYICRNNATKRDDEDFGKHQETLLFPIVKAFFSTTNKFKQHPDKWYYSDFIDVDDNGCEVGYEVKTRECYSTTEKVLQEGPFINTKKLWLNEVIIFNFWDKVYYYRVKAEQIKDFHRSKFQRKTRACGYENTNDDVTYIPFSNLRLLHEYMPEREHNQSAVKSNMDGAEQRRGRCLIDVSTL